MMAFTPSLAHKASACAVCRCKTSFTLVGSTELLNNVSKKLIVKKQLSIVYNYRIDCLQLSDSKTCDDEKLASLLKSWYTAFSFYG